MEVVYENNGYKIEDNKAPEIKEDRKVRLSDPDRTVLFEGLKAASMHVIVKHNMTRDESEKDRQARVERMVWAMLEVYFR